MSQRGNSREIVTAVAVLVGHPALEVVLGLFKHFFAETDISVTPKVKASKIPSKRQ